MQIISRDSPLLIVRAGDTAGETTANCRKIRLAA